MVAQGCRVDEESKALLHWRCCQYNLGPVSVHDLSHASPGASSKDQQHGCIGSYHSSLSEEKWSIALAVMVALKPWLVEIECIHTC